MNRPAKPAWTSYKDSGIWSVCMSLLITTTASLYYTSDTVSTLLLLLRNLVNLRSQPQSGSDEAPLSRACRHTHCYPSAYCRIMVTSRLLEKGRVRVEETLERGYAPSHFPHNLELIFVDDRRSSASLSMRCKIASTRERSAVLRTLEPKTLIWWAVAFPMRQWSGGRSMSSFAFDSLVRLVRHQIADTHMPLSVVQDDMDGLRLKYSWCQLLQDFLNNFRNPSPGSMTPNDGQVETQANEYIPVTLDLIDPNSGSMTLIDGPVETQANEYIPVAPDLIDPSSGLMTLIGGPVETSPDFGLSQQGSYVRFTGAQYDCIERLPNLLRDGLEKSRKFQHERDSQAKISTAFDIFVPTDPTNHDAYAVVPIGASRVFQVLHGLGILE